MLLSASVSRPPQQALGDGLQDKVELPERGSNCKGYAQLSLQNCFHKFATFWKTCRLFQRHCSYFQAEVLELAGWLQSVCA